MIFPVERAGERGGGDRAEYINAFGSGKLRRLGRHRPNRGVDILRVDDRAGQTRRTRRGTPPINGAFLGRKTPSASVAGIAGARRDASAKTGSRVDGHEAHLVLA